jgi:hypothetical protein
MILYISIAERPSLPVLQKFETKEGTENILETIGAGYSKVAICLLNDKDGGKLNTIKASNSYKVEPIVEDIFHKWLNGDHPIIAKIYLFKIIL